MTNDIETHTTGLIIESINDRKIFGQSHCQRRWHARHTSEKPYACSAFEDQFNELSWRETFEIIFASEKERANILLIKSNRSKCMADP